MKWSRLSKKFAVIIFVLGIFATTVYANSNLQPGSVDDPIVTKSYVDERLEKLKEQLKAELLAEIKNNPTSVTPTPGQANATLKVEKLVPGQKLYGFEGTEIIVRTGTVKIVAGDNGDGLPDLTDGKDLVGGATVPINHLLLVPRTDNRGIIVAPGSLECYVIIRGDYTITPPPAP